VCPQALAEGGQEDDELSVRITSPLGRTGVAGTIRIVAQITGVPDTGVPPHVKFFVDGAPHAEDTDGSPYVAEWIDENPFERREISAEVTVSTGAVVRTAVVLEPYEIIEEALVISVLMEAAVLSPKGRFVSGLTQADFTIEEDGKQQEIQLVRQEDVAATFALLVDSSQSMNRRIDFVRRTAERLLRFVRPVDRVIVAPFTFGLGPLTGPTDDRATVSEAIGDVKPGGGTAILDSLAEIAPHFDNTLGRRAVILITDGYDENSKNTVEQTMQALLSRQITVYVVAVGGVAGISLKGEHLLRQIAIDTGGRAFFPTRETELSGVYDVLATDAQNRYLITYTPENQRLDGSWRAVTIRTSSEEHLVRTRLGYFAPAPPPVRPSIEFTVTDEAQQYVDVTADDLLVIEDQVEQTVDSFQEAVTPVSVVLALDASGSMRRTAAAVAEAAREFVKTIRPEDSLAVVLFADKAIFAHDLSVKREPSLEAIDEYVASGGTALYDAISDAVLRLGKVEGRRAVVVMSRFRNRPSAGARIGRRGLPDRLRAKRGS
jgi:Ca-activated chloride channel family protein